jgi:hypothetical protein
MNASTSWCGPSETTPESSTENGTKMAHEDRKGHRGRPASATFPQVKGHLTGCPTGHFQAFNPLVVGSSPTGPTQRFRTSDAVFTRLVNAHQWLHQPWVAQMWAHQIERRRETAAGVHRSVGLGGPCCGDEQGSQGLGDGVEIVLEQTA